MSTDYSNFKAPRGFWSDLRKLDSELHAHATAKSGGWTDQEARYAWNRDYDGPLKLPADYKILTIWKGRRRFGGFVELSGRMKVFTPTASQTEAGVLPVNEKRFLYDASFSAPFLGHLSVFHHEYTIPGARKTPKEQDRHKAVGLEAIEKDLLRPTTVDYEQILEGMRIGASGVFGLPSDDIEFLRSQEEA